MYKSIEDPSEIEKIVHEKSTLISNPNEKHVSFRLGLFGSVFIFNHSDPENSYLLLTLKLHGTKPVYRVDITDEKEILNVIIKRESGGERQLTDENRDRIVKALEDIRKGEDFDHIF